MTLRLDSNGKPAPPDFTVDTVGCLLPIATAINGKFVKRKIGGVTGSDFVFSVPQNLKHPLSGIDNSVRRSDNLIKLKARRPKGQKRGFYEKVGCKGGEAPGACDLHHRGDRQPAVAEVHRDQAVEVLTTA